MSKTNYRLRHMSRLLLSCASLALVLFFINNAPVSAQFRPMYGDQGQARAGSKGPTDGIPQKMGQATAYPEFRSKSGIIRWIPQQMPLKVYLSKGLTLDELTDDTTGVPANNTDNLDHWPDVVADLLGDPDTFNNLPMAKGFKQEHYVAAMMGINQWKRFAQEDIVSFEYVDDPTTADIYVFWVHHFIDKSGLALFVGDIRGYTAKRSFPYKAVINGGHADFKPVVIQLRTTEANGDSLSDAKMTAAAAHEFGHALGIEGHSHNPQDLMSIYYGKGSISNNDATTLRYLYRQPPDLIP